MTRRYTSDERETALAQLEANDGNISLTSLQTGVSAQTLRNWAQRKQAERTGRLYDKLCQLQEQLATNAQALAEAIDDALDGAPLNQLASALGIVTDRYIKLDELLAQTKVDDEEEQVIRIEYQYPDGSIHHAPPWANDDLEVEGTLPGGGLRTAFWQNGNGQADADAHGLGSARDMLVAGSDLSNGKPGVGVFEDDVSRFARIDD